MSIYDGPYIAIDVFGSPCYNLQEVADRVYGDATRWKEIAAANGIDHPANLPATLQNLILPDVDLQSESK